MEKKALTDQELIEQFACKRVKAVLPKSKVIATIRSGIKWKTLWKKIPEKFR
jgi:hypothetical protein